MTPPPEKIPVILALGVLVATAMAGSAALARWWLADFIGGGWANAVAVTVGGLVAVGMAMGIRWLREQLDLIDQVIGCNYCGGDLAGSPSEYFCSEACRDSWSREQAEALTEYRQRVVLGWDGNDDAHFVAVQADGSRVVAILADLEALDQASISVGDINARRNR